MPVLTTRDGRRLGYSRRGSGPVLVAHPGGPGFGGDVFGHLGGLDDHLELVLVDPRGTGDSDEPDDQRYELDGYVDDLEDVLEHLDEPPTAVLGHSHGGLVALLLGARRPDLVPRLVVVDTPTHVGAPLVELLLETDHVVELGSGVDGEVRRLLRLGPGAGDVAGADTAASRSYGQPAGSYEQALSEMPISARPLEYFNDHVIDSFDLRSRLAAVTCPTLVVCGRDDEVAGPAQAQELADGLPSASVAIIEGAGHVPFLENPDAFRDAVLSWLALPTG